MSEISTSNGLIDPYGRPINSIRISITQRCNFNCFFCHQEGESGSGRELSVDEIETLVSVGAELGIKKVKLTGVSLFLGMMLLTSSAGFPPSLTRSP